MATPIPCDWQGCTSLADMLTSDLANGDGFGWCGPHYLDVCRQLIESVDAAAAAAEAQAADDEAVARLAQLGRDQDPTGSAASSDGAGAPDDGAGTPPGDGLDQDTPDGGTAASGDPGSSAEDLAAVAVQ